MKKTIYLVAISLLVSLSCFKKDVVLSPNSIPFSLGRDNRICIEGKINNEKELSFLFDTGADGFGLYQKGYKKMKNIKFTYEGTTIGGGGQLKTQFSDSNKISINKFIWDNLSIGYSDIQLKNYDGIIGYPIFEDKLLEINYQDEYMTVHDKLPVLDDAYSKCNLKKIGQLYFIEYTMLIKDRIITDWICFDTGSTGTLNINKELAKTNNIYSLIPTIKETSQRGIGPNKMTNELVMLPKLQIGKYTLTEIPIFLEKETTPDEHNVCPVIGGDILKKFNWIIDFQHNAVYLKPNDKIKDSYKNS